MLDANRLTRSRNGPGGPVRPARGPRRDHDQRWRVANVQTISQAFALINAALVVMCLSKHNRKGHRTMYSTTCDKREESELRFELALVGP
jgi:hypothetical protein